MAVDGHRQTRTHLPSAEECPLCPAHPGSEIPSPYEVAAQMLRQAEITV
ncbi:hypothetical protein ACFHYQ_23585 [Sphaerimonospora cavernae]|uniref:Uncharacterized protein n=1 Tax=Sphaerimonospora cavernae TaxID=1740611 RepID=A0ABV6UAW9_9ACTN